MNPQIAAILIQTFGPLALEWIKGFHAGSGGQFPTAEQLQAAMDEHAARFLLQGTNWLAAHPESS